MMQMIKYTNIILILYFVFSVLQCRNGSLSRENLPGGDFSLTDQDGKIFQLSSLKGKTVFLYFGYTYCPDACPMTLAKLNAVYGKLQDRRDQLRIVFVSVDPKRDTPKRLKEYLEYYKDLSPIGLTGKEEEIQKVVKLFAGSYKKSDSVKSEEYYLVDHSTYTYLIDSGGITRYLFKHDDSVDTIANLVKVFLK